MAMDKKSGKKSGKEIMDLIIVVAGLLVLLWVGYNGNIVGGYAARVVAGETWIIMECDSKGASDLGKEICENYGLRTTMDLCERAVMTGKLPGGVSVVLGCRDKNEFLRVCKGAYDHNCGRGSKNR